MDEKLKSRCDEKWEVAKAIMERDGRVMPTIFLANENGQYEDEFIHDISSSFNLQNVMSEVLGIAKEKGAYAVILTGPTILKDDAMSEEDFIDLLADPVCEENEGLIQIIFYSHGAIYHRIAEGKELPGGFKIYQDKTEGFERR